jgi:hypothetical protein
MTAAILLTIILISTQVCFFVRRDSIVCHFYGSRSGSLPLSSLSLSHASKQFLPKSQISTVMLPSLVRIISRVPRLKSIVPRFPRQLRQLSGAQCSQSFSSRPEVTTVCNPNGLINKSQQRHLKLSSTVPLHAKSSDLVESALPICCPGCGAYAQTVEAGEPGYYSKTRKQTRKVSSETDQSTGVQDGETGEPVDLKAEGEKAAVTLLQLIRESEDKTAAPKPGRMRFSPYSIEIILIALIRWCFTRECCIHS